MSSELLLDAAGRRRSPAAMPGHNAGQAPRNKGRVYPADPPTVDEIVAVMRQTPPDTHGLRLRALIVVLWRGGLRIQEALSLIESDLDPRRGSILIPEAKGTVVGKSGWTAGRGQIISRHGSPPVPSCRSARCSASSTGRRAAGRGQRPPRAASCAGTRTRPAFGTGSRLIS